MRLELPYGTLSLSVDVGNREVELVEPQRLPPPPALDFLIDRALANARLTGRRITLIVSDPSRREPRDAFVRAIRERIDDAHWTIAVATGTHGPCRLSDLGLSDAALRDATIVNHDGHRPVDLVQVGITARGTPVRVHRCLLDAALVIATGCIRPHYFAGFGAGVKALFPGLGEAAAIRINHRLKTEPSSRAGVFVGNPCRDDLEEAVSLIPTPTFLLNGVCRPDDLIEDVVAGDLVDAFRKGAALAKRLFTVRAKPAATVIASDALPVTATLYQAAKIAAATAPLVQPGGTLVVAAQCLEGVGPLDVVNEAIFGIGVLPRLPPGARLVLVSDLGEATTQQTLLDYAPSVEAILAKTSGPIAVVPRASQLICEPTS
ncbi:MAG TPA: lactate racemase domain-containing protein [Kofleriaceae bacterium]